MKMHTLIFFVTILYYIYFTETEMNNITEIEINLWLTFNTIFCQTESHSPKTTNEKKNVAEIQNVYWKYSFYIHES